MNMNGKACLAAALVCALASTAAVAQDQTIVVDQPLKPCASTAHATLDEADAEAVIARALETADPHTYYILHAVEFNKGRMTIAQERWYVYYKPWRARPPLWWVIDSRLAKHFPETRIFGASQVGLVYLYINVPTYETQNAVPRAPDRPEVTQREELTFTNSATGESLVPLSPTLMTTASFQPLSTVFYRLEVTKKEPAPLQNLKSAARLAVGQAAVSKRVFVSVNETASVCAGRLVAINHVPSNVLVHALMKDGSEEREVGHQTFDNEAKSWWDVSFALPLQTRNDLTVNVEAGQIAAKKVQKADLFAVIDVGVPRDTKKVQLQLVPTLIYGMPITGKPLQHHLVGASIGLNYVQVFGGARFDRREQVVSSVEGNTPTGSLVTPSGDRWTKSWVWGLNIPVQSVVNLLKNAR